MSSAPKLGLLSLALALSMLATLVGPVHAAPPTNDDFAAATALNGTDLSLPGETTAEATGEPGEPNHARDVAGDCSAQPFDSACSDSVWYAWTAPRSGEVVIDTCDPQDSTFDTVLAVYTGSAVGALSEVVSNDDDAGDGDCAGFVSSRVTFRAVTGTTYRIAVASCCGSGPLTFPLHLFQRPPPSNDDFAAASPLDGTSIDLADQTTAAATGEPGEPNHAGVSLRGGCTSSTVPDSDCLPSVWYTWTSGSEALVTIDLCDATTKRDTTLGVYTGSAVNALSPVASNDDAVPFCPEPDQSDNASRLTFRAAAGTTYRIAVAGFRAGVGPFALHLRTAPAPPLLEPAPGTAPAPPPPEPAQPTPTPSAGGKSPADTIKPLLSALSISPSTFAAAGSGPSISTKVAAEVSYKLSEGARVKLRVERALRGRRSHGRCVRPRRSNRHGKRCTRYGTLGGSFTHNGNAGQNKFSFGGRLRNRKLEPDRYRLRAVATDAAKNSSPLTRKRFRIVRR